MDLMIRVTFFLINAADVMGMPNSPSDDVGDLFDDDRSDFAL
jgi:hypothetical protein